MEQQAREQAFITALVTEHFVLQSAIGAVDYQLESNSHRPLPSSAGCPRPAQTVCVPVHRGRVDLLGRVSKSAALLCDLRPSPGGPARRGPEITSTLLASPGTVARMFSLREPMRPARVPTLRVGFVNGMPYQ